MRKRRFVPERRRRSCRLQLPPEERHLLQSLPTELARTLAGVADEQTPPHALRRLFPRAYSTDDVAEKAFADATRSELVTSHREALETVARTASASSLTEEQMGEWLTALTEIRLVLGTVLGVTDHGPVEDSFDESSEAVIYQYLTYLQSELIDVMEQWLPDPLPGADAEAPEDPWGEPLGGLRWDGTPEPEWPPRPGS